MRTGLQALVSELGRVMSVVWSNLSLLALSILLAVGLWIFVTNEENPERAEVLADPLTVEPVNVPETLAVFGPLESVTIEVSAPEDVLEDLDPQDFRTVADLSVGEVGENQVPVRVEYTGGRRRVDINEVVPARISVTLEPVIERTVPVEAEVVEDPAFGLVPIVFAVEPATMVISGPAEAVNLVERVRGEVDLSEVTVPLEGLQTDVDLVPVSGRGFAVDGVGLAQSTADVVINVERQAFEQALPVVPAVGGVPAPGFVISGVTVDPATVVILAPLDVLEQDLVVTTEPIVITDQATDTDVTVNLVLPQGVSSQTSEVTVTVELEALLSEATVGLAPTFINVPGDQTPTTTTSIINVQVRGDLATLTSLQESPGVISAVVDLAGLDPGTYTLPVEIELPDGMELVSANPEMITVTLPS
ncbi:MAG: hypothetical protein GEU28_08395 [Dehalococcoidia bacterium]|nr:hypothetical protein [Dehalococcoidia bacterium]